MKKTKANDRRTGSAGAFDESPPRGHSFEGGPADPRAAFQAFNQEIGARLDTAATERAELAQNVAEFSDRIESVRESVSQAEASFNARFEELRSGDELGEVRERLEHLDQRGARLESLIGQGIEPAQNSRPGLGRFGNELATHPEMEAYQANDDRRAQVRIAMNNRLPFRRIPAFGESTVIVDDSLVSDGSLPVTRSGLTELLQDPIGLVDIVNMVPPVAADQYQSMVEDDESLKGYVAAYTTSAVDGDPTPKSAIPVDNLEGWRVGSTLYVFLSAGRQALTITGLDTVNGEIDVTTDSITFDIPEDTLVTSEEYLATGESATKPAGVLKATLQTVELQTLASYIITTRQRLRRTNLFDLAAWAGRKLPDRLRRVLEWHLLYGDGVTNNGQLHGFLHANNLVNTDTWSTDMETGDNRADLILYAAAQIPGNGQIWAVLHKMDWLALTGAKDGQGNYVHGEGEGPRIIDTPGLKAVGAVRVALSSRIAQTTGLVLDPMAASELAPGGDAEMITGFVNDQLIQNQYTMLYEESYGHLLLNPTQAWRKLDIDSAPA